MIWAVILHTQVLENYGDGEKPWWKPKGGESIWAYNLECEVMPNYSQHPAEVLEKIETRDSIHFIEMVRSVEIIPLEEAEERLAIKDDDYERYFDQVRQIRGGVHTYKPG